MCFDCLLFGVHFIIWKRRLIVPMTPLTEVMKWLAVIDWSVDWLNDKSVWNRIDWRVQLLICRWRVVIRLSGYQKIRLQDIKRAGYQVRKRDENRRRIMNKKRISNTESRPVPSGHARNVEVRNWDCHGRRGRPRNDRGAWCWQYGEWLIG